MPDGIMGTDLVARLTATRPDLPVIFTSGYSQESDEVHASLVDGVNFLQKPYRPGALIRLIHERLGRSGWAGSPSRLASRPYPPSRTNG